MKKYFNPKIKEIKNIGDELRFQRLYYCFKNNVSLPLKIDSTIKQNDERECLQDVLYDFIQEKFGNNSELATSYEVLYAIENGKSKKKSENYNINAYFLRMFSLLKMYGFLDDDTILDILENKYKLKPSFESTKKIQIELDNIHSTYNYMLKCYMNKCMKINVKLGLIFCTKDMFERITTKEERIQQGKQQYEHLKKILPTIYRDNKLGNAEEWCSWRYKFTNEKKLLIQKMEQLSEIEQYCASLEIGRDTLYIKDFINDDVRNITFETMLKTLEYFKMTNEKLYIVLKEIGNEFNAQTIRLSEILK